MVANHLKPNKASTGSNPVYSAMNNVNSKLYICEDCSSTWLVTEPHWNWAPLTWCSCGGHFEELCVLHREIGRIGFYAKCDACHNKFLCASSVPNLRA